MAALSRLRRSGEGGAWGVRRTLLSGVHRGGGEALVSTGEPARRVAPIGDHQLAHGTDDPDDPAELTIFTPEDPDRTTEWITIDYDCAIPSAEWD